jgi:DNA-binding response OmpR family regulator
MPNDTSILAVDSNRRNLELLAQHLGQAGYQIRPASSLDEFDREIESPAGIGLALIDLSGFDQRIWERCERLRHASIPFIVLTAQRSPSTQREGIRHGASGILTKPLGLNELLELVKPLLSSGAS